MNHNVDTETTRVSGAGGAECKRSVQPDESEKAHGICCSEANAAIASQHKLGAVGVLEAGNCVGGGGGCCFRTEAVYSAVHVKREKRRCRTEVVSRGSRFEVSGWRVKPISGDVVAPESVL